MRKLKRVHVRLDDDDWAKLHAWSRFRGWTMSQAAREAVRMLAHRYEGEEDALLQASGMLEGLPVDASERWEEYLRAPTSRSRS